MTAQTTAMPAAMPAATSAGYRAGAAWRGALGLVASVVRIVTGVFSTLLVVHLALTVLGANPFNVFTQFFAVTANALTLGMADLFLVASPVAQVVLTYGVPAIAWAILAGVVVSILRTLARPRAGLR